MTESSGDEVASPFSMSCDAYIRTCPIVVTGSGMTGSDDSFAALYLGTRLV